MYGERINKVSFWEGFGISLISYFSIDKPWGLGMTYIYYVL